jgi:uncharacterized RDD family membrane protein YckC
MKAHRNHAAPVLKAASRRKMRVIVTPEGAPLTVEIAEYSERAAAFILDILLWFCIVVGLYALIFYIAYLYGIFFFASTAATVLASVIWLMAFLVRVAYFSHFELAWQGSTPGKRAMGLRVVDRRGGPLTPSAVFARNLTREFEIFIPIGVILSMGRHSGWAGLLSVAWILALALLPFLNRDRMRGGDLIAGTIVIALPKRALLEDVAHADQSEFHYAFADQHLTAYGAFELQVLEEVLRGANGAGDEAMLRNVGEKIRRKIGWTESVDQELLFLKDFYTTQRAYLERQQLFGKVRADKNHDLQARA